MIVIGNSQRRGYLVVEKHNHTMHVPHYYMELKRLHDDEQYSEDFRMTTPDYVSMCRKKDIIEDKAFE